MGKLTAKGVQSLKEPGRYADSGGLYLNIAKGGSKSWMYLWRANGRRREMGLGSLSVVSLAEARQKADEARRMAKAGRDPIAARKREKGGKTFADVARDFLAEMTGHLRGASHRRQYERALLELCDSIAQTPIAEVTANDVLTVLRPVWLATPPSGKKMRTALEKLFGYAKAKGLYVGANPALWADNLSAALPPQRAIYNGHRPAMAYPEVPNFMAHLATRGTKTATMMRFAILTCARSTQAREAVWGEMDIENRVWRIPVERMKGDAIKIVPGEVFEVPLAPAAIEVLRQVMPRRPKPEGLVFEGEKPGRPLADANPGRELAGAGYGVGAASFHGFRASFRTWAAEKTDFEESLIERCLAHAERRAVVRAYQRSDLFERRRPVMEAWAKFAIFGDSEKKVSRAAGKRPEAVTANPKKVARIER